MTDAAPPSPLATPLPWDLVSTAYEQEIRPRFEAFAADALRRAAPPPGGRIVDVACGPGTLSLLAARTAARVDALDFSAEMLARLRARIEADRIANVVVHEGDGQALPFADASFDAGFSMFGLMFFPDRARGFAELARVLRPGARAVVSSWRPFEQIPALVTLFSTLRAQLPHLPFGNAEMPLSSPERCRAEMSAAFDAVEVHPVTVADRYPSAEAVYDSIERSMAPLVLLQHRMGEAAWRPIGDALRAAMIAQLGPGPQEVPLEALLTVGVAPAAAR
jgi:SAM-dependent methyltransferase